MEGCPRSLMLTVDLKESFPTEFTAALKKHIREHYNEDEDSYTNECSTLEQLRTAALHPTIDHSGCSTLRRYYAQLHFLQSRFPMGEGGTIGVQFTWTDLYSEEPITLCDIRYEQSAILHNLAALHTQLGSMEDRTAEEGMKVACTHFQAAAGVYQYLKSISGFLARETMYIHDHFTTDAFFDMANGLLQANLNIMLGQAQECLLEKSLLDSRKDSLIARISVQVQDYYQQAVSFLETQGSVYMGSRKAKNWAKALKIKCCYHLAVAYVSMSNNAHDNQKFGEKVAYLKAASQKTAEAQKLSKGQPERTLEILQFLMDVVGQKLEGAVKDNDFIYHEVVPELSSLPEIKGAQLVKPIPFQPCDPSVSGADIFQRLIPMEAHTDASLYSEEKARLLRKHMALVEDKNKKLSEALANLHIDDLLQPEETDNLPAVLKEKNLEMRKKAGSIKNAEANISELLKTSSKADETLKLIADLLHEDEQKEKELEDIYGPRPPDARRSELLGELEQCQESHKKATKTSVDLSQVFKANRHNLDLLSGPPEALLAVLPSLNIIDTPVDDGAVQILRDLIAAVDKMKAQRRELEMNLRKEIAEDDITQLLITRDDGNKQAFFDEQLKKHDRSCSLIQTNLDAQDNILQRLTEANAKYAPTRQAVKETSHKRDEAANALIISCEKLKEIEEKISRGLQFYVNLEKNIAKLEEKCKQFHDEHGKEMAVLLEKAKKPLEQSKPPARPTASKPGHLIGPGPGHMMGVRPPSQGVVLPPGAGGFRSHLPPSVPNQPQFQPRIPPGVPVIRPPSQQQNPSGPPGGFVANASQPYGRAPEHHVTPAGHQLMTSHGQPPLSHPGHFTTPVEQLVDSVPRMSYPVPIAPTNQPEQPPTPRGPTEAPGARPTGVPNQPSIPRPHQEPVRYPTQAFPGSANARFGRPQGGPAAPQPHPGAGIPQHVPTSAATPQRTQFGQPVNQQWPRAAQPLQGDSVPPQIPRESHAVPRHPQPTQQHAPQWAGQQPLPPQLLQRQLSNPGQFPQDLPHVHPISGGSLVRPQHPVPHPGQPQQQQPHYAPQAAHAQMPYRHMQPQGQLAREHHVGPPPAGRDHRSQPGSQFPAQPSQQSHPSAYSPGSLQSPPPSPLRPPQRQSGVEPGWMARQQGSALHHAGTQSAQVTLQPQQQPQLIPQQQQQQQHQQQQQYSPQPLQAKQQPVPSQQLFQPQRQLLPHQQPLEPTQSPKEVYQQQQPQPSPQTSLSYQQSRPSQPMFQLQPQPKQQQQQQQQAHPSQQPPRPSQPAPQTQQPTWAQAMLQPQQTPTPPRSQRQPQQPQGLPPSQPRLQFLMQSQHQASQPHYLQQNSEQTFRTQHFMESQKPLKPDQQAARSPDSGQQSIFAGKWQSPGPNLNETSGLSPAQSVGKQPSYHSYPDGQLLQPASRPLDTLPRTSQGMLPPQTPQQPLPTQQSPTVEKPVPPCQTPKQPFPFKQTTGQPQETFQLHHQASGTQQPAEQSASMRQPPDGVPRSAHHVPSSSQYTRVPPEVADSQQVAPAAPARPAGSTRQAQYPWSTNSSSTVMYAGVASSSTTQAPSVSAVVAWSSSGGQQFGTKSSGPVVAGSKSGPSSSPAAAYMNSYSVSLAYAQLSQQQQMQQMQQQMLLQQQQLIMQQQELMRQQQLQHQHDNEQVRVAALVEQLEEHKKQLADLEEQLKGDKEVKHTNAGHQRQSQSTLERAPERPRVEAGEPVDQGPVKQFLPSSEALNRETKAHLKVDLDNLFDDFSKRQLCEISQSHKASREQKQPGDPKLNLGEKSMKKSDNDSTATAENGGVLNKREGEEDLGNLGQETGREHGDGKEEENEKGQANTDGVEADGGSGDRETVSKKEHANGQSSEKEKRMEGELWRKQEIEAQIEQIKELQKQQRPLSQQQQPPTQHPYEPRCLPSPQPEPSNKPVKPDAQAVNEAGEAGRCGTFQPKSVDKTVHPPFCRQFGHYCGSDIDEGGEVLYGEELVAKMTESLDAFQKMMLDMTEINKGSGVDGYTFDWKNLDAYQQSDSVLFSYRVARLNPSKNRYRDILPFDHSRVKLTTKEGGDYINANSIMDLTSLSPAYVATQGPIASTLADFWLLVWEQQAPVIVMLTREVEGNRLKCHQYWPIDEGHSMLFGTVRVTLRSVAVLPSWVKRVMHVQHNDSQETLILTQLQFTSWPDHGAPYSPSDLLAFMSEVEKNHRELDPKEERPMILHCSAGVGRTGAFVVIYSSIRQFRTKGTMLSIPCVVRALRQRRRLMVQKKIQYEFCYRAIFFYAEQCLSLEKASLEAKKALESADAADSSTTHAHESRRSHARKQSDSDDVTFIGELASDESGDDEESAGWTPSDRGKEHQMSEKDAENYHEQRDSAGIEADSELEKTQDDSAKETCLLDEGPAIASEQQRAQQQTQQPQKQQEQESEQQQQQQEAEAKKDGMEAELGEEEQRLQEKDEDEKQQREQENQQEGQQERQEYLHESSNDGQDDKRPKNNGQQVQEATKEGKLEAGSHEAQRQEPRTTVDNQDDGVEGQGDKESSGSQLAPTLNSEQLRSDEESQNKALEGGDSSEKEPPMGQHDRPKPEEEQQQQQQ